jgi:hypothetical protein
VTPTPRARFESGRLGIHCDGIDEAMALPGFLDAKAPGAKPPIEA